MTPAHSSQPGHYRQFYDVTTAATAEPLTVEEAKLHLRVDETEDDAYIAALISLARDQVERALARPLVTQTIRLRQDRFSGIIELRRPPVQTVTSVTYVDTDGATQTLAANTYTLDIASEPARLLPAYGLTWPSTRGHANDVTITFTAGYGAASAVPEGIKHAMRLLIGQLYDRRQPVNVGNIVAEFQLSGIPIIDSLLNPHRWEIH